MPPPTPRTSVNNLLLAAGLITILPAQAALHDRGGGLIYDDVLNLTWLADADYAGTSGGFGDGRMTLPLALMWADTLVYHDSVRNVDYNDWRLPTVIDTGAPGCNWSNSGTDCGYNVQTVSGGTVYSELAHMYYNNLGFKAEYSPTGVNQTDYGIFGDGTTGGERDGLGPNGAIVNLKSFVYWSETEYTANTSAWYFNTMWGFQATLDLYNYDSIGYFAWAVRPGDVVAVPEPESYVLLLAGLGLVGVAARQRRG